MAYELAAVYVPVIPSLKGAKAAVQAELGGIDVGSVGTTIGTNLGSKITSALGGVVKVGAVAAGATVAAGLGTALVKGFQRLDAIDNARAKLTGLGNDAGIVSTVMSNALSAVRGTAFGLGDAATVAAQLVAAQIKPGEQLQGVLKSVTNSAAAAGVGMNEMGSIYAKVASLGKAQNDVLQQVADRGIPIYQALGNQLGVTADEVFEMASAGKIGFAEFEQAMTTAAGTVADELGGTVGGSFANFTASLGRIGAGLLSGVFPQIAPTLQGITTAMAPLEAIAGRVGTQIGDIVAPAMGRFVAVLNGGARPAWLMEVSAGFTAMSAAFKATDSDLTSSGFAGFMEVLGLAARDLTSAVSGMFAAFQAGGNSITSSGLAGVFQAVGLGARAVVDAFAPLIPQFVTLWANLSPVSLLFQALAPLLPQLASTFGALAVTVGSSLGQALQVLLPAVQQLASILAATLGQALQTVLPVIVQLVGILGPVFSTVLVALLPVITTLAGVIGQLLSAVVPLLAPIVGLIAPIAELVGALLPPIVQLFAALLQPILALITPIAGLLVPVLQLVVTVLAAVIGWVAQAITWFVQFVTGQQQAGEQFRAVWTNVMNFFAGIGRFFADVWNGLIMGIATFIVQVVKFFQDIPSQIESVFSGAGRWLVDVGRNIIQGLLDGAGSLLRNIGSFFLNVVPSWIREPFAAALGIHSPSRVFANYGRNTMEGYIEGLTAMAPRVRLALTDAADFDPAAYATAGLFAPSEVMPRTVSTSEPALMTAARPRGVVNQYISTQQTDPRIQARQWGREAERAFSAS